MHRFGSLNPKDYGGMPYFLAHTHGERREYSQSIREQDEVSFFGTLGRDSSISTHLAKVGRPLEQGGENQKIQVEVEKFVNGLLKCAGKLEGRFISKVIPSGSFYEGTKITAPDEFDFMAEIQVLSFRGACSVIWHSAFPGCPIVKPQPFLAHALFSDVIYISGSERFLSIGPFYNAFEKVLVAALDVMDSPPPCWERRIKIGYKGPSITLGLTWNGQKYRKLDISIDITPAIKFFHWPQWTDISAETPTTSNLHAARGLSSLEVAKESYSKTLKEKVTKLGFHVVPAWPFWRASFSVAEMHILKTFSPDSNRLTCYRCAKYFRDQQQGGHSAVLTSYHLKTAFLFELEKFPEDECWSSDQLFARLYCMMKRLLVESKEEVLGSYFVSSFSISKNTMEDKITYAIERILEDLHLFALLGPN